MQIVTGALRFLPAVVMLTYVPGKLVLHFLKCSLTALEDVTLSIIVGLIVSAGAYWLIAFVGGSRFYFIWPFLVSAVFVNIRAEDLRRFFLKLRQERAALDVAPAPLLDGSHFALTGIIALGVLMLAILPQYYANLTFKRNGEMRVSYATDVFFHLAIVNELTHAIPPQAPVFAGLRLNYHYGMDLSVAMFAKATGVNTRDLSLRFMPTLFLIESMLAVFCFSRQWLGSGYFAALATLLVFFGEDFSFIPGLLLGLKSDWSVASFVPTVFSLFYTNPMLPGLGLLFAGLFCLQKYLCELGGAWLFLTALVFTALMEVKVFTAIHIMCSLGIAAVVYLGLLRSVQLLKVAALTAILALPLLCTFFISSWHGADMLVAWGLWPYVAGVMQNLGLEGKDTGLSPFVGIALPLCLIGTLGPRVLGVPRIVKDLWRPSGETGLRFMLAVFVVIGIVITLTCRVVPEGAENSYNNAVWFFAQSKYVAWIFAVATLQSLLDRVTTNTAASVPTGIALATMMVALAIPSTIQHFVLQLATASTVYTPELLATMDFIAGDSKPGDVLLAEDTLIWPVLALTRCRVPVSPYAAYIVPRSDYNSRLDARTRLWLAWRAGEVRVDILRELGVDYLTVKKAGEGVPPKLPPELMQVYSNDEYVVLNVNRLKSRDVGRVHSVSPVTHSAQAR